MKVKKQVISGHTKKKWSKEEIEFLKENYNKLNRHELSKKLNRSFASIDNKRAKLGLYKIKFNEFELKGDLKKDLYNKNILSYDLAKKYGLNTRDVAHMRLKLGIVPKKIYINDLDIPEEISNKILELAKTRKSINEISKEIPSPYNRSYIIREEINQLSKEYTGLKKQFTQEEIKLMKTELSNKKIAELTNRNAGSIANYRYKHFPESLTKKNHKWTDNELKKILELYNQNKSIKEIASFFNVSYHAVHAQILKLANQNKIQIENERRRWTQDENDYLIKNYREVSIGEISNHLNRSIMAIRDQVIKLRKLGLIK